MVCTTLWLLPILIVYYVLCAICLRMLVRDYRRSKGGKAA